MGYWTFNSNIINKLISFQTQEFNFKYSIFLQNNTFFQPSPSTMTHTLTHFYI
jgi:hypothetical protein